MIFHKILIANRAEIAERVIRTCKKLGIGSIAVYSTADKDLPYVKLADESIFIGQSNAKSSYLNIENIVDACIQTGASAVHPGYGFLSENADFVNRLDEYGIKFIGPSASTMLLMGDKIRAREFISKSDVPVVPGYHGEDQSLERLQKEAKKITYPVMVKASAGGGGRGLRIAQKEGELVQSVQSAASEAKNAFHNDSVFLEKYINNPKHIEVQILSDQHGNAFHIFERECSLQRRHQKVIEECPSPSITQEQRDKIFEMAVTVAKSVNYEGAGTIEFIYSPEDKSFYFLEMNTRLQVEHPVSEMVSGLDLVELQIKIAAGEEIAFKKNELQCSGHSIEARLYAEDPGNDFFPDAGKLRFVKFPEGKGVRVDTGIETGSEISIYYDAMLAKIIVHDKDREHALKKLQQSLDDCIVLGIKTNLNFLKKLCLDDDFHNDNYTTNTIKDKYSDYKEKSADQNEIQEAILAGSLIHFSNIQNKVDENEKFGKNNIGIKSSSFRLW